MLLHLQLDLALHNTKSIGKVTLTIENFIFELGMTLKSRFENDKLDTDTAEEKEQLCI